MKMAFTPAVMASSCEKLPVLDEYPELARASSVILKMAFGLSFFYNGIALSFAVTGHLTPVCCDPDANQQHKPCGVFIDRSEPGR
jgi:hypothetical protein